MITLSIIVPVYNVSKYIAKCLDSLLCQDLSHDDYEIIVVDDGSTDNSGCVVDEYARRYPNFIKVIHQDNKGLGGARNTGVRNAKGKYIQFVDSDDFIEPNVLKKLVDKMECDTLDILRFNYQNVNEEYIIYEPYKNHKPYVDYRDEICDGITFLNERLGYGCYAWQFMIRTDLLQDNADLFLERIYFEDTQWTPRVLIKAKRVTSVKLMVYNYLFRQGSITNSVSFSKRRKVLDDKLLLVEELKCQMQNVINDKWYCGMISITVVSIINYIAIYFYEKKSEYLERLKKYNVYPLSTYHTSKSVVKKIVLINFSPRLTCWLLHLKNR